MKTKFGLTYNSKTINKNQIPVSMTICTVAEQGNDLHAYGIGNTKATPVSTLFNHIQGV